jgi:hypothetical protein
VSDPLYLLHDVPNDSVVMDTQHAIGSRDVMSDGALLVAEVDVGNPDLIPGAIVKFQFGTVVILGPVEPKPWVVPLLTYVHAQRVVLSNKHVHPYRINTNNISLY